MFEFFARQHKFAMVFTLMMVMVGFFALTHIQRDRFPNVDFEVMTIYTSYPNSSPLDVEQDITNLIEDEIKTISGIEKYSSLSKEGLSRIDIQIDQDAGDVERVKDDIRTAVTGITDLPDDANPPRVIERETSRAEIIRINIGGDYEYNELSNIATKLKEDIEIVPGVSEINEDGNIDTEMKIYLKPELLSKYRLSLQSVINSIQSRNYRYTAGDNNNPTDSNNIVVLAKYKDIADVENLIVKANFNGGVVHLKDVAEVKLELAEVSNILRVNGKSGYELTVRKAPNADVITTVDAVKMIVEEFKTHYDERLNIFYTRDGSKEVRNRLEIVSDNGLMGFVAVLVVLGAFLSLRTAFWVAMGMTVSLLGTVALLWMFGETINLVSLAAIVIVLGIVVDDSIIVAESITDAKTKDNSYAGVVKGYKRVIRPVLTTIITSIMAMSSMFLMGGTMGKFIYLIPLVVIFALVLSLIEVSIALPAHLSSKKVSKPRAWFGVLEHAFLRFISFALRVRYLVLIFFFALAAGTMWFYMNNMSFNLFPEKGAETINVRVKTSEKYDLEQTSKISLKVEQAIIKTAGEHLEFISADIGGSSPNRSQIEIQLTPANSRTVQAPELMDAMKAATKNIPNIKRIDFSVRRPGPPQGRDVELVVISNDDVQREEVSRAVEQMMKEMKGVSGVRPDDDKGKDRIQMVFDFEKMARLGVNFKEVQTILRSAFSGVEVTKTRKGDKDINYRVFLGKHSTTDILNKLTISNNQGRVIPLTSIMSAQRIGGESDYNHYNGKRSVTIGASVDDKITTPLEVTNQVITKIDVAKNYPEVRIISEGGAKDTQESMQNFAKAFLTSIVGIYLILMLLFNSYTQPFMVLSAVPFALVGVVWSFYFHGEDLSFFAVMGALALVGVIVNDSLVMVSHLNYVKEKEGRSENTRQWIAEGSRDRLRAVVLTSVTTLVGVMPLAYGIGGVDYLLQPMVLALGYGLLFGTMVTLILLPCLYMMNYEFTQWVSKIVHSRTRKSVAS